MAHVNLAQCVAIALLALRPIPMDGGRSQVLEHWGTIVDPAGDCQFAAEEGRLTITVPGTNHDLNPSPQFNNMDAPRVLQTVKGDFLLEGKVAPYAIPEPNTSSSGIHSYVAAGLLIWQDNGNFLRWTRSANGDSGALFASFEAFSEGKQQEGAGGKVPDKPTHLRVERRGDSFLFSISLDGRTWQAIPRGFDKPLATELRVGVMALNTTTKEVSFELEGLRVLQAK